MTYLSRMFLAPRSIGGAPLPNPWYDPNGEGLCVWEAWLAKGAASYAASKLGLANGRNLTEPLGAIFDWTAGSGWQFVSGDAKYFTTGFTPDTDQSQSILIQLTDRTSSDGYLIGGYNGTNLCAIRATSTYVRDYNGVATDYISGAPIVNGNVGLAGNLGYRDGVVLAGTMDPYGAAGAERSLFIGCLNLNGVPTTYTSAYIQAVVIYDCVLTGPQMLAVATAMAAL